MRLEKLAILILLITTIIFLVLWITTKKELDYYLESDLMYMAKRNEKCDQFKWKKNGKTAFYKCDMDGDDFYDLIQSFDYFERVISECIDKDANGLVEILKFYNLNGEITRTYLDSNNDGFMDEQIIHNEEKSIKYIDKNHNGIFESNELE